MHPIGAQVSHDLKHPIRRLLLWLRCMRAICALCVNFYEELKWQLLMIRKSVYANALIE